MSRKVVRVVVCLAVIASVSSVARADSITFSFLFSSSGTPINVNASGLSTTDALSVVISDATTKNFFALVGTASISTGAATSFMISGNQLTAKFNPGSGDDVEVMSSACSGGSMPGVCILGMHSTEGVYQATNGGTGSFQDLFDVLYVSPDVTALFHLPNAFMHSGSDSLNTSFNNFLTRTTDSATLSGGAITFQTPVPEANTLALVGSGLLGLGAVARRRILK